MGPPSVPVPAYVYPDRRAQITGSRQRRSLRNCSARYQAANPLHRFPVVCRGMIRMPNQCNSSAGIEKDDTRRDALACTNSSCASGNRRPPSRSIFEAAPQIEGFRRGPANCPRRRHGSQRCRPRRAELVWIRASQCSESRPLRLALHKASRPARQNHMHVLLVTKILPTEASLVRW